MFVARNPDNSIYGLWSVRQFPGQEELPESNPEVIAFLAPKTPDPRLVSDESERQACKIDATIMPLVNMDKAGWVAWCGTNFPTLTSPERTRLGNLFWVVSVGVRRSVRNGG